MSVVPGTGLWCDDFDADLPKVVPNALDALGASADVELQTYCKPTNGRINCPSAWWTDHGLTAFFATRGWGGPAPAGCMTTDPLVDCTFWEVVRDEWIHGAAVVVNGRFVWAPPENLMMELMFDLRGWGEPLTDEYRTLVQERVRVSLSGARNSLLAVIA